MRKITLVFFTVLVALNTGFGQANLVVQAPNGPTTTQVRAPNGTTSHGFLRACSLVLASELTNLPSGSNLTNFGFTLSAGTGPQPVTGNFTVYLQNTTDVAYLKTTSWATIMTGMTSVYASTMTVPNSIGTTSVMLTLGTPFNYTGGGLYVAYDWVATTTPNPQVTFATYYAEGTALSPGGCSTAANITSPGTTLGTTAFRPSFLFGVTNPYSNDIQVVGMEAPGKVAASFATPHNVIGVIRNSGGNPQSNITVSLNVTGANPFTDTQTITALAAGAVTTVTFAPFNPVISGSNTITVLVPADDNNPNNQASYGQSVTCSTWAQNPSTPAGTYTSNAVGFGAGAGILATPYLSVNNSTLTGLRAAISNDPNAIGRSVYGVALTSAGVILGTTNTLVITNTMSATFQEVTFTTPQNLAAGTTYYMGFAQIANTTAYYPAGTYIMPYIKPNTYYSAATTGGAFTPLPNTFGYFGIEGIFTSTVSVAAPSQTVNCGTTATLSASGNGTSYNWSTGAATFSVAVTPTLNAVYTVSATSTSGCLSSRSVSVTVTPLALSATSQTVTCGNTTTLTATSAANYSWSTGATNTNIVVTPTVTTTYTVNANTPSGCSASKTATVTINPLPVLATVNSSTVCPGLTVSLSVTGATSYIWGTSSGTLSNSNAFTDIPAINTTYTVVGSNSAGCHVLSAVAVTVNAAPNVAVVTSTDAICIGSSVNFTASGASTYSWSIAGSTSTANISDSPLTTTEYTLSGADAAGCISTVVTTVTVNSVSLSISGSTAICNGTSTSLTASGANSITWNNTFNFPTYNVTPTVTTTYTVNGLETSTGCSATETVVLIVIPKPNVTATASKTVFCKGENLVIDGGGAASYVWSGGALSGTATSAPSITVSPIVLGAGNYSVTGTDASGCVNKAVFTYSLDACLGIQNAGSVEKNILLFPNPNTGVFTVSFKSASQTAGIEIYNTLGALVKKQMLDAENTVIDLKNEPNGIYFINVTDKNKIIHTSKIVKQ